ncbi:MAG: hypothetical protein LBM06_04690 [Prevotellaceae bacterium]|jgi:C-terminal processing protease CtpA/Prc|nr:hypothetical protein [Prevotellaceae bacterium]
MKPLFVSLLLIAFCSCRPVEPTEQHALSKEQTRSLVALGQLWGFLKYHHPAVAEGTLDWDAVLIDLIPRVMDAKNEEAGKSLLDSLIKSLPAVRANHTSGQAKDVSQKADYGILFDSTYYNRETIDSLQCLLEGVRLTENHYVRINPRRMSGEPLITVTNEASYPEMVFPTLPYRILALCRYWSFINYYFPYRELCDVRWSDALAFMLPDFVYAGNQKEYALACLKLASLTNDSHAFVHMADSTTRNDIYGRRKVPFEVQFVENELVVTSFTDASSNLSKELSPGDIITAINGEKVQTVVARLYPYMPASNDASKHRDIARIILQTNDSVLNIGCVHNGKLFTKRIPTYAIGQLNIPDLFNSKPEQEGYSILGDSIGYIYPATCKYEERETKLPRLMANTKGLIIDLRCYPADYNALAIAPYLMKHGGYYCRQAYGTVAMPGYTFFSAYNSLPVSLEVGRYPHKVVVIVNEITQSQAEDHTFFYYLAPQVTIIGSTTAGANGAVARFTLPGNIECTITGVGMYYPDGTCTQRTGVKLDETVYPTIAGIKQGRDEVLERAIEIVLKYR